MDQSNYRALLARCHEFSEQLVELQPEKIVLLHHNDSDGLTSGAIISAALERKHFSLMRYCLEKPYPIVLEKIISNSLLPEKTLFIFIDFGSGMLPIISKLNTQRFNIMLVDHHAITEVSDPLIKRLNCLDFDIIGSTECSSSTLAYSLAIALDPENSDLLPLAILGAVGDGHIKDNSNIGMHEIYFNEALKANVIDESLNMHGLHNFSAKDIVKAVDAFGSFAYFSGGPDIAIKGLLEGFNEHYFASCKQYLDSYQNSLKEFMKNLNLQGSDSVKHFVLADDFSKFGVKTVGLICEHIINEYDFDSDVYLLGFQKIPDQIPGLGSINFNQTKLSARVSKSLYLKIMSGTMPSINTLIPEATKKVDGFYDACHLHAGAATIANERIEDFVAEFSKQLGPQSSSSAH